MSLIALLTDFGTKDPFVGLMKSVILSRCADARIVDLTHDVAPQAVAEGAFWLDRSVPWLSPRAIVVAVVDPGVGTERRGLVCEADGVVLIGPDNGLLTRTVERAGGAAFGIDLARLALPRPSATFHGRDVFAPIAGEIAAGRLSPRDVGPIAVDLAPSALALPVPIADGIEGEVITIDRFGNLITNVEADAVSALGDRVEVSVGAHRLAVVRTYADVATGAFAALVNAFGVIEVAQRDGSAASALGEGPGARVSVRRIP